MQVGLMTNPAQPVVDEITWAARHGFTVVDVEMAAPHAALESTDWRAVGAAAREHARQSKHRRDDQREPPPIHVVALRPKTTPYCT